MFQKSRLIEGEHHGKKVYYVNVCNVLVLFPHAIERYYTQGGKYRRFINMTQSHRISNDMFRDLVDFYKNEPFYDPKNPDYDFEELCRSRVIVYLFEFDCWMSLDNWLKDNNVDVVMDNVILFKGDGKYSIKLDYNWYASVDDMIKEFCHFQSSNFLPVGRKLPRGHIDFNPSPWG